MNRKSINQVHAVKASIENVELTKAGTSTRLEIYANAQKIGELVIGRGSLSWYGRNRKRKKRIDWSRFAEMMDKLAYGDNY
jgi:hypothetical protein